MDPNKEKAWENTVSDERKLRRRVKEEIKAKAKARKGKQSVKERRTTHNSNRQQFQRRRLNLLESHQQMPPPRGGTFLQERVGLIAGLMYGFSISNHPQRIKDGRNHYVLQMVPVLRVGPLLVPRAFLRPL